MKKLIIISIFSLFIFSCGDNLIEEVKERYDDGKLKVVKYYKKIGDNQEFVRTRYYYENGQLKKEENYINGRLDGKYISYYENGQLKEEEIYINGRLDGKYISYYENGQLREDSYIQFLKEEIETDYIITTLTHQGKYIEYYENGQIKEEGNYKEGKEHGKFIYYNENGQIRCKYDYIEGNWITEKIYENGRILSEFSFKDNPDGRVTTYYDNGQIESEKNFIGDNVTNVRFYNKDGSIDKVEEYKNGLEIESKEY